MLATPTAAGLLDDPDYDSVLLAIWAFVAGGMYGFVGYFVVGLALLFGVRLLGSLGSFRRTRQTVGFALVPLAVSLLLVLPLRLAVYGGDTFRAAGRTRGRARARCSSSSWYSRHGRLRSWFSAFGSSTAGAGRGRWRPLPAPPRC